MIDLFYDADAQGFFYTARDHERLIARNKEIHDGSTPSGNSMAATALLRLGRLCGHHDLEETAVRTLEYLSPVLAESPTAAGQALLALDFLLGPTREIAIVEGSQPRETEEVLAALHRRFVPNKVVARRRAGQTDADIAAELQPLLKGKAPRNGATTIYICEHGTCGLPVTGVSGLESALA
jgi:uncharacterized protein